MSENLALLARKNFKRQGAQTDGIASYPFIVCNSSPKASRCPWETNFPKTNEGSHPRIAQWQVSNEPLCCADLNGVAL